MELCMSFINSGLIKHNIILGLDDRGKISCQKVNLCFIYFDPTECIVSFFIYVMTKSTSFALIIKNHFANICKCILEKTRNSNGGEARRKWGCFRS